MFHNLPRLSAHNQTTQFTHQFQSSADCWVLDVPWDSKVPLELRQLKKSEWTKEQIETVNRIIKAV
jgi:hypothetical protein